MKIIEILQEQKTTVSLIGTTLCSCSVSETTSFAQGHEECQVWLQETLPEQLGVPPGFFVFLNHMFSSFGFCCSYHFCQYLNLDKPLCLLCFAANRM